MFYFFQMFFPFYLLSTYLIESNRTYYAMDFNLLLGVFEEIRLFKIWWEYCK